MVQHAAGPITKFGVDMDSFLVLYYVVIASWLLLAFGMGLEFVLRWRGKYDAFITTVNVLLALTATISTVVYLGAK